MHISQALKSLPMQVNNTCISVSNHVTPWVKIMDNELPVLIRQARQLLTKKSYHEAVATYQEIVQCEDMKHSKDMWLRLAWCYEQMEAWGDACAMYEHVADMYEQQDEADAAQALDAKVQDICAAWIPKDEILESSEVLQVSEVLEETPEPPTAMDFPDLLNELKGIGDVLTLTTGEVLCEAGDPADFLWLLEDGVLGIQLPEYLEDGEDMLVAEDGVSVLLGELGLFTRQRRSARVRAKQTSRLFQIPISTIEACESAAFKLAMLDLLKHYWMYPILSKHSIFERMNDVDRRALCDLFTPICMPSGVRLIHYGEDHDGAYLLQQGCLFFICKSETGEKQVSSMFPGDMVHLGGLLHAYEANYEVRTATSVRLLHLSRHNIESFIKSRPWMVDILLRYSRRAAWRQVMHPDDAYLWMTNREIHQRRVSLSTDE